MEPTIKCPDCGKEIKLTDAMAAPLLANAKKDFDKQLAKAVSDASATAVKDAETRLSEMSAKLATAQKTEADAIAMKSRLEDKEREMDLTIQKRVASEKQALFDKALSEAQESVRLTLAESSERERKLSEQLEDMKKRLEQRSQQAQGEILELEIENRLRTNFPQDKIAPVPKGEFGGDILLTVMGGTADPAGLIIIELKRTKNWSDGWLPKLRADQRAAHAEIAVIVTYALPKDVVGFGQVDGVWVCTPEAFLPLCMALRFGLMEIKATKRAMDGMRSKSEQVYEYLIGPRFKHRIGAIIEYFTAAQNDLHAERKAMERIWSKREESIKRVISSTAALYGEIEGIAGGSLEALPGLTLEAIAG